MSNTEGGVRVNAFATGGLIPPAMRGTRSGAFIAIEDWYATFCALAGVEAADARAAAAGLPPPDGHDLWPLLSSATPATPGRAAHFLGSSDATGQTLVQGVIRVADGWKLLLGGVGPAFWTGPVYPNASSQRDTPPPPLDCGSAGCLFNVLTDPHETQDVAAAHPGTVAELRQLIAQAQAGVYSPHRGDPDPERFCSQVIENGGFVGPFLP